MSLFDHCKLDLPEQMNQLSELLCGHRGASYEEIKKEVEELLDLKRTVSISYETMCYRKAIEKAFDELMETLDNIQHGG